LLEVARERLKEKGVTGRMRYAEYLQNRGTLMHTTQKCAVAIVFCILFGTSVFAQTAKDIRGPSPLVAIENEPAPRLIVDPPLAEQLARGLVFIQYRTENLRVMPVFGKGALDVSPRIGHIHITVDDATWHFVDASGETIILVGLEPGPHKVLIVLADPTHKPITSETMKFTVPDTKTDKAHDH